MRHFSLILLPLLLSGCALLSDQPDGKRRVQVNNPAMIAQLESEVLSLNNAAPLRLTLGQVLERYVPASYTVYVRDGVDSAQLLTYDASRPWDVALPAALKVAGIDIAINAKDAAVMLTPRER